MLRSWEQHHQSRRQPSAPHRLQSTLMQPCNQPGTKQSGTLVWPRTSHGPKRNILLIENCAPRSVLLTKGCGSAHVFCKSMWSMNLKRTRWTPVKASTWNPYYGTGNNGPQTPRAAITAKESGALNDQRMAYSDQVFSCQGKSTSGMKHGNLMLSRPIMQRSPCSEYISNKQVQPQVWTTHLVLLQWSFNGTGGGRPYPSNDNVNNI